MHVADTRQPLPGFFVRRTEDIRDRDWLALRAAFWDGESEEEHLASLEKFTGTYATYFAFIANDKSGAAAGFVEISVRRDYVNGCEHCPVLYLEGLFVRPDFRESGIARILCAAAEKWGRERGIREFASDSDIDNAVSIRAHKGLGFEEMDRVVCFRKLLSPESGVES